MTGAGSSALLELEETRVYASHSPEAGKDGNLKGWLDSFLDRQPSFRVCSKERRAQLKPAHCPACARKTANCPHCNEPLRGTVEKGVDTAIITDLLTLAWEGAYDVAILVSSDADLVSGVERLQAKGLKVGNATLRGTDTCWPHRVRRPSTSMTCLPR